jgi:hypothetical protein
MLRIASLAALLVVPLTMPAGALTLPELRAPPASANQTPTPTPIQGCCKHCPGKACGDTCIARYMTCHVGPGCACNG